MNQSKNKRYDSFIDKLKVDLSGTLPGEDAQDSMAPHPRNGADRKEKAPADANINGVLILLYHHLGRLWLPLILRPDYPGVHSGQISLPGGRIEECDSGLTDTALRETQEEIGVNPQSIRILGKLTPLYIGSSNNLVQPFVGCVKNRPAFAPDEREVALLIETPISELLNKDTFREDIRQINGRTVYVPYYHVCDQIVWGATAMILSEFLALPSVHTWQDSSE